MGDSLQPNSSARARSLSSFDIAWPVTGLVACTPGLFWNTDATTNWQALTHREMLGGVGPQKEVLGDPHTGGPARYGQSVPLPEY